MYSFPRPHCEESPKEKGLKLPQSPACTHCQTPWATHPHTLCPVDLSQFASPSKSQSYSASEELFNEMAHGPFIKPELSPHPFMHRARPHRPLQFDLQRPPTPRIPVPLPDLPVLEKTEVLERPVVKAPQPALHFLLHKSHTGHSGKEPPAVYLAFDRISLQPTAHSRIPVPSPILGQQQAPPRTLKAKTPSFTIVQNEAIALAPETEEPKYQDPDEGLRNWTCQVCTYKTPLGEESCQICFHKITLAEAQAAIRDPSIDSIRSFRKRVRSIRKKRSLEGDFAEHARKRPAHQAIYNPMIWQPQIKRQGRPPQVKLENSPVVQGIPLPLACGAPYPDQRKRRRATTRGQGPALKRPRPGKKQGQGSPSAKAVRYTCAVCAKVFNRRDYLAKHSLVHTGNKPHGPCIVCNKRFSQRSSLVKHMRVHNGAKPFACSRCDRRFSDLSNQRRHEKRNICTKERRHSPRHTPGGYTPGGPTPGGPTPGGPTPGA